MSCWRNRAEAAAADIRNSLDAWIPRFQKLTALCQSGAIDDAYKLRNENKIISAKMHLAAAVLVAQYRQALDAARAASPPDAARAGEAGLSFAVLADEVRNLARRSAQAATEAAGLIEESILKTRQGHATLQNASGAMGRMTAAARQIALLVDGVKTGGAEQTKGVRQIATAMARVSQLAQSSAAVGQEMNAQADTLSGMVERVNAPVG